MVSIFVLCFSGFILGVVECSNLIYGVDFCVVFLRILFWALPNVSDNIRGCVCYLIHAVIFLEVQVYFLDLFIV